MIELYVLDVPEFGPVITEGTRVAEDAQRVGHYVRLRAHDALIIDRKKAGARQAIWYSAVGALRGGAVAQFDKEALRIEAK